MSGLRERLAALADAWDDPDPERGDPDKADVLRALLAEDETSAAHGVTYACCGASVGDTVHMDHRCESAAPDDVEALADFRRLGAAIHLFRCANPDCRHYDDSTYFTPRDNDAASAVVRSEWLADRLSAARREGADAALAPVEAAMESALGEHRAVLTGRGRYPERLEQCVCDGCRLYRAVAAAAQGRDAAKGGAS